VAADRYLPHHGTSDNSDFTEEVMNQLLTQMAILVVSAVTLCGGPTVRGQASSSRPEIRALLIGCTDYQNPGIPDLFGPANDVRRFREVLTSPKYGVPNTDDAIITVTGDDATRQNIVAAFERLVAAAQPDQQIVILLAGHGAQQQDDGDDEVDGLDEIFCPIDVGYIDETGSVSEGGITDDEIGSWLKQMSARGAKVWLIADSCHNGTLSRGARASGRLSRGLGSGRLSRGPGGTPSQERHDPPATGVVAFYAAPPTLKTFEDTFDNEQYGAFSWTMCNIMQNSTERLTYRRLLQKIHTEYDKQGWRSPTPQMEAAGTITCDTVILGDQQLKGSDIRVVAQTNDGYRLNAGRLRGVTEGTILGVYSSAEDKQPAAYVEVTHAETTRSTVVPCEFQGINWSAEQILPLDGFCDIARSNMHGLQPLKVAAGSYSQNMVDRPDREALSSKVRAYWTQVLHSTRNASNEQSQLIEVVNSPNDADWVLRPATPNARHIVYLSPTELFQQQQTDEAVLMSPSGQEEVSTWLTTKLPDIARSCNLIKIAGNETSTAEDQLPLVVELRRIRGANDNVGRPFDSHDDPTLQSDCVLHPGDLVGVFVRNPNPFPINVTVLFIDGKLNTTACFPQKGATGNQLGPAGAPVDHLMAAKLGIDDETLGVETVITIATKATPGEPHDFTFLESTTIQDAATRSAHRGKQSPLEALMRTAVYNPAATRTTVLRDPRYSEFESHAVNVISWTNATDTNRDRGLFAAGAENLKANVVVEQNTRYHTSDRTQAVLGSYGRLIKGNKLLFRPHGYDPAGRVADVNNIAQWKPFLHKTGITSLKGLMSFTAPTEQWQVSGLARADVNNHVTYAMKGQRLVAENVIEKINKKPKLVRYFQRLRQKGDVPIVITQNIVMSKCKIGNNVAWNVDAKLHLAGLKNSVPVTAGSSRATDQNHKTPLVRCYLMHEVILEDNEVVALERFPKSRF
jgi:hypothetical protein